MSASLYDLSLRETCRFLDPTSNIENLLDEISIITHLPRVLERQLCKRLKQLWMNETVLPFTFDRYDCRYLDFDQVTKYDFIMLTNYPDTMEPDFWPIATRAHVYYNYYEFWLGSCCETPYVICRRCFIKHCTPSDLTDDLDFIYSDYWKQMGWRFFNVVSHFGSTPSEFVRNVLKVETSWCDFCILFPLFRLYNWTTCSEYTNVHVFEDDSEEDSNDSCLHVCDRTEMYDPYIG